MISSCIRTGKSSENHIFEEQMKNAERKIAPETLRGISGSR
jgi:hypothetical protein